MLPWRVQLQRLTEALRDDAAFRNRLVAFAVAMVLLIGAFTSGLEVTVRFGGDGDDGLVASGNRTSAEIPEGAQVLDDGTVVLPDGTTLDADTVDDAAPGAAARSRASGRRAPGATAAGRATSGTTPGATVVDAGGDGDPCAGARLGPADQGVSETEVKVGFLIPNLNELNAAGFSVGLQGNWDAIIAAWMKELNERRGGLGCRSVTAVKEIFDVLSVDDMIAKCKAMTEDHKVFAVLTPGGYDSVAQLCIAKDHKTPLINPEPEPADWYREARPYLWNLLMSKDRMHRNHIRWLKEAGEIKPGMKVGVVYHGIPNVAPSVEKALLPELDAAGIKGVQVAKLSSDDEQALAQINQVVLQFQRAQVEFVLMPMNLIFKTQFMQQAENQQYFPTYTDSDHYFGCFDFVTATYPERSWDRTKCVSAVDVAGMTRDEADAFARQHPFGKYSDEVYKRAHPGGYHGGDQEAKDAQRALFISMGSQVMLLKQAADRVGPNLTRAAWGESMGQTGEFRDFVSIHPLTFGPEKWDGPNHITVVEWHAEAGNGYRERRYRKIVDPFPAYY